MSKTISSDRAKIVAGLIAGAVLAFGAPGALHSAATERHETVGEYSYAPPVPLGIVARPTVVTVRRGGKARSYFIRLRSEPAADVVVRARPDDERIHVRPANVRFTPADWDRWHRVRVSATELTLQERIDDVLSGHLKPRGAFARIVQVAFSDDPSWDRLAGPTIHVRIAPPCFTDPLPRPKVIPCHIPVPLPAEAPLPPLPKIEVPPVHVTPPVDVPDPKEPKPKDPPAPPAQEPPNDTGPLPVPLPKLPVIDGL